MEVPTYSIVYIHYEASRDSNFLISPASLIALYHHIGNITTTNNSDNYNHVYNRHTSLFNTILYFLNFIVVFRLFVPFVILIFATPPKQYI